MKAVADGALVPAPPPTRVSTRLRDRRQTPAEVPAVARVVPPPPVVPKSREKESKQSKPSKQSQLLPRNDPLASSSSSSSSSSRTSSTSGKKRKATDAKLPPKTAASSSSSSTSREPCRLPPYTLHPTHETPSFAQGMDSVVNILRSCRNIVVLTGAGISVSCGIPDFRSKGTGVYSVLDCEALGLSCPEELFDWEFFQNNPRPFFQFSKKLYFPLDNNQKVQPSDSHKLLRLLQDRKQLLRVYSQNIDGLEEEAGVASKKVVYAHGSLKYATCMSCRRKVPSDQLEESVLQGDIPLCQAPCRSAPAKTAHKDGTANANAPQKSPSKPVIRREPSERQRIRQLANGSGGNNGRPAFHRQSSSGSNDSHLCGGILKPNVRTNRQEPLFSCGMVTFFGQVLPDNVSRCLESDRNKVDALIVIGTSLSVAPISKVIGYLPANIPRILINRTIAHPQVHAEVNTDKEDGKDEPDFRKDYVFDAYLLGNCDDVTRALVKHVSAKDTAASRSDQVGSTQELDELEEMGRLLSEVRQGKNVVDGDGNILYRAHDWERTTVPAERVFLFPGAEPPTPLAQESAVKLQEVCHCNACSQRIRKGHIHKCLQCFDFDLCATCFPRMSQEHFEGGHQFGVEEVTPTVSR